MISKLIGLLVLGLAVLLAAPLHAAWQSAVNGRMLGKRMPPLALQTDLSNAVVLVEFWAPWCAQCRDSVPLLNRLQREYGPRGLRVIGMAREPPVELAEFASRVPLDYPVGCDRGGALFATLGLRSVPYAVLVDRNGIIVWQGNPASLRGETIEATLAAPAVGALMRF